MRRSQIFCAAILFAGLACHHVSVACAQQQNGGNQFNAAGGITIDADGVVQPVVSKGKTDKLEKRRMEEFAGKTLNTDVNKPSPMRKVSLSGLERAYEPFAGKDELVPVEIFYLAGLQRIDYVFVYPEEHDIVIAGPAEGFAPDEFGRVVGISNGRAALRLDDLVIALRAVRKGGQVGCSIDALPERLAALKQYVAANSTPTTPARAGARYGEMAEILGMQKVTVWGVPPDSHFSLCLVEADYRMKRIAVGLDNPGVRGLRSHLSMLMPQGNTMQRWWMAPLYDAIVTTPDRNAYQFGGQRVQLLSQEEVSDNAGRRRDAAFTRLTTQQYAQHFTEKFPDLAEAQPIFSELQNLFDLLILGALIVKEDLNGRVGWEMPVFLDEERSSFPKNNVPKYVASVSNFRRATGGFIVGLISGGVVFRPAETFQAVEFRPDTKRKLDAVQRESVLTKRPDKSRWWWD